MGALLSILATVGPTIAQGLIKLFEAKMGPKTGDQKKQGVMEILLPLLDKLFAGTGIPVNQDVVSKFVDDFVTELNKRGELGGGPVPAPTSGGTMTISGTLQVQK